MSLPANFRDLSTLDRHRAIRDLAATKGDARESGSPSQDRWDEIGASEDAYIQAIEKQQGRTG
jgi:hypothetical protein